MQVSYGESMSFIINKHNVLTLADSLDADDELMRTLAILDTAAVLGLTDKEAKLQLMASVISPFDIVEGNELHGIT